MKRPLPYRLSADDLAPSAFAHTPSASTRERASDILRALRARLHSSFLQTPLPACSTPVRLLNPAPAGASGLRIVRVDGPVRMCAQAAGVVGECASTGVKAAIQIGGAIERTHMHRTSTVCSPNPDGQHRLVVAPHAAVSAEHVASGGVFGAGEWSSRSTVAPDVPVATVGHDERSDANV